jgi:membrane-associated phospholipid phosphatase
MTPPDRRTTAVRLLDAAGQAVLVATLWLAYALARHLFAGSADVARRHAEQVWNLERDVGLPDEQRFQRWVLSSHQAIEVANFVYKHVHFPAMIVTLLVLFTVRRTAYIRVRNVVILTTALALVGHVMFPLAPPRLVPHLGIVDTGRAFGESAYQVRPGAGFANQFAAMPSMHVAWAIIIAAAVVSSCRTRWRWLAVLYPVLIVCVVVVTGNHYWVDGIGGAGCLAVAAALVGTRPRLTLRRESPAARLGPGEG